MKDPQIISVEGENPDLYLAIWGGYVIDNTTQVPITTSPITIQIDLFNVTDGSTAQVTGGIMTYDTGSKFWSIPLATGGVSPNRLMDKLVDRNKYVGRISEPLATRNMREFVLEEFARDDGSFEETLMRLPFQVEIGPPSWIVWYDSIDPVGTAKFKAKAYENGSGVTYATEAARVTHRGPIIPF